MGVLTLWVLWFIHRGKYSISKSEAEWNILLYFIEIHFPFHMLTQSLINHNFLFASLLFWTTGFIFSFYKLSDSWMIAFDIIIYLFIESSFLFFGFVYFISDVLLALFWVLKFHLVIIWILVLILSLADWSLSSVFSSPWLLAFINYLDFG